jgi:hypothetical protein
MQSPLQYELDREFEAPTKREVGAECCDLGSFLA